MALTTKELEDAPQHARVIFPEGTAHPEGPDIHHAVNDGAPEEYLPWELFGADGMRRGKATSAKCADLGAEWYETPQDT